MICKLCAVREPIGADFLLDRDSGGVFELSGLVGIVTVHWADL